MKGADKALLTTIAILVAILALAILYPLTRNNIRLSPDKKPALIISQISSEESNQNGICTSLITATLKNSGTEKATQITITCRPAVYPPIITENLKGTTTLLSLESDSTIQSTIQIPHRCDEKPKFECTAACTNC